MLIDDAGLDTVFVMDNWRTGRWRRRRKRPLPRVSCCGAAKKAHAPLPHPL